MDAGARPAADRGGPAAKEPAVTIRVDRDAVSPSRAIALDDALDCSRDRRSRNVLAGRCLNENAAGTHGAATHGGLCRRCRAVHRYGAAWVAEHGDGMLPDRRRGQRLEAARRTA